MNLIIETAKITNEHQWSRTNFTTFRGSYQAYTIKTLSRKNCIASLYRAKTLLWKQTDNHLVNISPLFSRSCAVTKAQEFFHGTGSKVIALGLLQMQGLYQAVTFLPQGIDVRMM